MLKMMRRSNGKAAKEEQANQHLTVVHATPEDAHQGVEFGTLAPQRDESHYDKRQWRPNDNDSDDSGDDDLQKGRIQFPKRLYGRDKALQELAQLHDNMTTAMTDSSTTSSDNNDAARIVLVGGHSGSGKSALVQEFVKQQQKKKTKTTPANNQKTPPFYCAGKYNSVTTSPFSALSQALNSYLLELMPQQEKPDKDLKDFYKRLQKADIAVGTEDTKVLTDTLVPCLEQFLQQETTTTSGGKSQQAQSTDNHHILHDINLIKSAFQNLVQALASQEQPLVMFIDDLQWADNASLQLIQALLSDKGLKHVMFIGAYRSNEVDTNHPFAKLKQELKDGNSLPMHEMEVSNLSPDSIGEFIADCIDRSKEDVLPITEAVYGKTLGNIFFVKQALEELVRKNAIYYDVMMFGWQFGDLSRVELEGFLSEDVVQMVQSKIATLPQTLQTALALAAYTHDTFDVKLLLALLKSQPSSSTEEGGETNFKNLEQLMRRALDEGLILHVSVSSFGGLPRRNSNGPATFKFAHDKIREAACASVPAGKVRDEFLLNVAMALLKLADDAVEDDDVEWMLFTAVSHLNSIPTSMTDPLQMAQLNLRVGKLGVAKSAFSEAAALFRAAQGRVEELDSCWEKHYDMCLDLYNNPLECEHTLGQIDKAQLAIDQVFQNAKTLAEKIPAQYVHVYAKASSGKDGYSQSADAGIEVLKAYGIDVPPEPTDKQVKREKFQLRVALRGRSIECVCKFPVATDVEVIGVMKIAQITMRHAGMSQRSNVSSFLGNRLLRVALTKKVITKNLPFVLLNLGGPLRKAEKYEKAFLYANTSQSIMDRFPNERAKDFLMSKIALYATLICLRIPFRDSIETFLDLNKELMAAGEVDPGLGAGMHAMTTFMNASLPLGSLMEPKLLLFEQRALNLGKKNFHVIFILYRQCLYNLQGGAKASSRPAVLDGEAFNEEAELAHFEGGARKMTLRDISMFRLMLAVVFNDEDIMEEMLDRLDSYPLHDPAVPRQHVRLCYVGFASLILEPKSDKHKKWADSCLAFFEKLARFGAPNAQPVHKCLKALRKPSKASFNEAIDFVADSGLLNLSAIMNERCALWLISQQPNGATQIGDDVKEYLKTSLWCFHDWGATAKVLDLQKRFRFLGSAMQEKPPSLLSSVRRRTAMLGVPRPGPLSSAASST